MSSKYLWYLVVAGMIVQAGRAQSGADSPCPATASYRPAPSPAEIISGKRLPSLWGDLGIPARLKTASHNRFAAEAEELDCTEECTATGMAAGRLLGEGEDSLIRVCDSFGQTCRFLLLHLSSSNWSLVDYIDSPFEKYEPPSVRVEASQDRRWLVRRGFGGGGTGIHLAISDWFELRCGELREVLSLPSDGWDVNARPARYISTRFRNFSSSGKRESLEFGFIVAFQDYPAGREIWQEERTVVFSRTGPNTPFEFDAARSGISAAFKGKLFAFDSMDENDFINFAYERLRVIAADPKDGRRDWLRDYLAEMEETAKVRTLEILLNKR
jgi:hypothetical protein